MIDVIIKRVNLETNTHTGRTPCKQAKERGLEQMLPSQPSEGTNTTDALILDFQLQNCEAINVCSSLSRLVCGTFYSSPSKQIQPPTWFAGSRVCTNPQGGP